MLLCDAEMTILLVPPTPTGVLMMSVIHNGYRHVERIVQQLWLCQASLDSVSMLDHTATKAELGPPFLERTILSMVVALYASASLRTQI